MYGYNAEPPIAIPIYTVLPYCVIGDYVQQYFIRGVRGEYGGGDGRFYKPLRMLKATPQLGCPTQRFVLVSGKLSRYCVYRDGPGLASIIVYLRKC